MSFFQIGNVLQYDNSTKWLNEEISSVVTQVTELCTLFDKKFIKVINYILFICKYRHILPCILQIYYIYMFLNSV